VLLHVAGVARELPVDASSRAFLAVLPGSVRRADVALEFLGGVRPRRVDFGRGDGYHTFVPGSVTRALTTAALGGGPELAFTTFQLDQASGPRKTCVEPGRVIAGEAGQYDRGWEVFLDAPTLAQLSDFEDGVPSVYPSGSAGACVDAVNPEDHVAVLTARAAVTLTGLVGARIAAVHAVGTDGAPVPVLVGPGLPRAFAAQLRSTGAFGERAVLTFVRTSGKRRRRVVHLGRFDLPEPFSYYETRGRRLRIHWAGGSRPPGVVKATEGARRVRIRLTERYEPSFTDDGLSIVYTAIGISRCFDIRLERPLGDRRVIDATTGRRARQVSRPNADEWRCRPSRPRG
jgi:hypothetical protein